MDRLRRRLVPRVKLYYHDSNYHGVLDWTLVTKVGTWMG